jgi:outer membrane protein assembly factor BamB
MKTAALYLLVLYAALAAAAAGAYPGDIIASFYVPGVSANGPRGLAFDGSSYYFVADNRGPKQVRISRFTYDGESASLAAAFNCPADVYWAMDLAYRPGRIYVASDLTSSGARAKIYVLDEETGQITNNFNAPFGNGVHVNGLAWDGSYLYASSYESPLVYRLTFNGSVAASFAASHAKNHGLAAAGSRLWLVSGQPHFDARQYTTAGTRVATFTFDVNDEYVGGACAGRLSGQTIFVSTYTGARYIYEIATDPRAYGGVAVEPASLGRVKALFR